MQCPRCACKIEPETLVCPQCAGGADPSAPGGPVCDIFLMGFSEPSSFEAVVDYLSGRSFRESREEVSVRLSDLPALITKGMEVSRAGRLRRELEEQGGIIEVRQRQMKDRGAATKSLGRDGSAVAGTPPPPARGGRVYLILFLVSFSAVVYLGYYHDFSRERATVQRAVRKIASRFPSSKDRAAIPEPEAGGARQVSEGAATDPEGVRWNNEGVSLMDQGQYDRAVEAFGKALERIPGEPTILQNLSRAWIQQGYRALRTGDYEEAVGYFEQALQVSDESPEVYKFLGMAALNLPDEERALSYLRIYFDRVPDDPEVARIMGEILYKENRLEEALRFLKIYLAADPEDERVRKIVEKAGREAAAEEGFETHEAAHFDIRYDGMENLEARYLVGEILEDAYQRIGAALRYYPEDRLVTILYSEREFQDVTQTPDWARGLYDGKIRIPVGGVREKTHLLERVVAHEYTHALVHRMAGGHAPAWLNEGMAQYFEGEPSPSHAGNAGYILRTRDYIPPEKLEGSFLGLDGETASVAYTESYTLVDLIIQEHGIFAVQKLLAELRRGSDTESALRVSVGMDYAGLEEEWLRYLAQKYSAVQDRRGVAGGFRAA